MAMERTQVFLEKEMKHQLKVQAQKMTISMSGLIRLCVKAWQENDPAYINIVNNSLVTAKKEDDKNNE